jgi:hypothetical protein
MVVSILALLPSLCHHILLMAGTLSNGHGTEEPSNWETTTVVSTTLFLEDLVDLNQHQSSKEETMVSQVNRNVDSSTLTDSTFVSTNLAPTEHTQLPKLNLDHQLVLEVVQTQPPLEFKPLQLLEFKPQPLLESKPQQPLESKPQPLLELNQSQEPLEPNQFNQLPEPLEPNQLLELLEFKLKEESEVVPHLCLLVEDHHLLAQIKHVVMHSQDPMKTLVLVIWLTTQALVPMVV